MPPKRRDKESDSSKNSRADLVQADHELFLQAFEKPTQIYRFLRSRNVLSPIFLNRTLTYMKNRMSRSNKSRKNFRIDSILERVQRSQGNSSSQLLAGYMTLTFLGFYDKKGESQPDPVQVETLLLKICHKKRKDVSCPVQTKSLGTCYVAYNPSEDNPPPKVPALSIPTECFSLTEGNQAKSYHLLLRVGNAAAGNMTNGDIDSEPPHKRRKSLKAEGEEDNQWHQYGTDLIIYDKQNRCLLSDGHYELLLEPMTPGSKTSIALSSWEYIGHIKEFSTGPTIKFFLRWSREPVTTLVDRPKPISVKQVEAEAADNKEASKEVDRPDKKLQIVYQFLYNNNSRQQTEACEDLHCPWCSLDCDSLYCLLKHLKLCHSRFTFTYVPIPGGARIDVAINEYYDGSYSGCPQDLISQPPGGAFSRNGPVRRTCVSNILVCYPKRPHPSLSEFLELDENEFDGQRPYITGHNRLYHHTTTCLPIYPKEMDVDSEDENDPKWLQTKTMMMIDEFTDVNEGEKELMKMWNLHVMRHGYVGDCQIPLACNMYLQAKGRELLKKNLYRNFVLHMCNLFDFGLVSPVTVYTTIQKLQELVEEDGDESKVLQQSCQAQRQHWVTEGAIRAQETRRINSPAAQNPTERRKPSSVQPKAEKRPVTQDVSKKRTSEGPASPSPAPPAKKKLNIGLVKPNVPVESGKEKKKPEKNPGLEKPGEKDKDKNDSAKRKIASNGVPVSIPRPQPMPANKDKESAAIKLRRKSSNPVESSNPVVLLRRKSFAGATDALRKKTLENGTSSTVVNATKGGGS
ncbi:polycomb protein suz12-B-like isoform X2 [Macrosteles quadrilineatus]|uniref:polycomb protein suz12-B-like isoform X2 n=1 Tax=Macrosteles quadrilineatus TaxID=74068 RepID=UPI0023E31761|nr:polycomb protein suz12-B-like isoform X2 [Macrosteles quadrilineatus]